MKDYGGLVAPVEYSPVVFETTGAWGKSAASMDEATIVELFEFIVDVGFNDMEQRVREVFASSMKANVQLRLLFRVPVLR